MKNHWGNGVIPGAMRTVMLAGLLVFLAWGTAGAGEWQTYVEDTFTTTETMFYTGQAGEAFYAIDEAGRYIVDGMNTSSDSLSALTEDLYYYYLEGKCELLRSTAGELAFTGLVFHYNKSIPGKLSYYVFYYYGDGYYGAKRVVGDQVDIIIPLTPTDALDMYGVNILGVDAQGTRFDLYINGRYVDGFTDVRIDGGGFGFYISKYSKSAFDDFKVKVERRGGGLEEAPAPAVVDNGNVADGGGGVTAVNRDFPAIPKDPGRPVYSWEVGYDKTGKKNHGIAEPEPEPEPQPEPIEPEPDPPAADPEPETPPSNSSDQDNVRDGAESISPDRIAAASLRSADPDTGAGHGAVSPVIDEPVADPVVENEPATEMVLEPVKTLDLSEVSLPPGEEMMTGTRELKNTREVPEEERLVVYTLPAGDSGIGESLVVSPVTREQIRAGTPKLPQAPVPDVDLEYADLPDPDSSERLTRYLNDDTQDASASSPPLNLTPVETTGTGELALHPTDPQPEVAEPVREERPPLIIIEPDPEPEPEPEPSPVQKPPREQPADNGTDRDEQREVADSMRYSGDWDDDDVVVDYRILSALEEDDTEPAGADPAAEPLPDPRVDSERLDLGSRPADLGALDLAVRDESPQEAVVEGDDISLSLLPVTDPAPAGAASGGFYSGADLSVIQDDFATKLWPESDSGTTSYRYFGAAYEVNNLQAQTMAISFQEAKLSDLEIMLDAEFLDGQAFVGFGLAARFQVVGGVANYYGLFISESGEFLLLKVDGGQEQILVDWTASPFIQANKSNRIGLDLRGDRIVAFINGAEVASVSDGSIRNGGYAMLAGPGTAARFDNLYIRGYER